MGKTKSKTKLTLKVPEAGMIFQQDAMGNLVLGGKYLTEPELLFWKERINEFLKNPVWELLSNSMLEHARYWMFENAKSYDDMVFGKAMLYAVDRQNNIMRALLSAHLPKQPEPIIKPRMKKYPENI